MTLRWPQARLTQLADRYAFAVALAAVFFYFIWRNSGLYPMVFADEWLYSSSARLLPFDKSILPSYLFLGVYRLTNSCGPGFLDCARILNAALLVGAAPFIYLIARQVCSRASAAVLALAAILAPVSSFTAYFMPETMYFFAFFVFAWAALARTSAPPLVYGLATGALLGLMSAIKVHALFLLAAHLAFILYVCLAQYRNDGWLRRALMMMAAAVVAMVIVRLGVGYAVAGRAGLNFLGNFYGTHATNTSSSIDALVRLLPAALASLKGHMLALALLMSLPLATLLLHAVDRRVRAQSTPQQRALQVFALLMLGAAGAMTVMFTATIASAGPLEGVRLHQRYYDFAFPLLLVIAAAPLALPAARQSLALRALVALPLAAAVLYAARVIPAQYSIGLVDTPELSVLTQYPLVLDLTVGLALLALAVWTLQRRAGILLFVFAVLPVTAYNTDRSVREIQARSLAPNDYDNAGILASKYLDRQQTSKLTVAGEGGAGLTRALFHIDNSETSTHELRPGAPFAREDLPPRQDWVLIVGDHPLPEDVAPVVKTAQFTLVKVEAEHAALARIEFTKPLAGGVLTATEGLSNPEGWGVWSDGTVVRLRFAKPLPRKLNILLKANSFAAAPDQEFVMVAGSERRPFHLTGTAQDRFFQFETDGTEQEVTIEIPKPVSPRSVGYGPDDRLLGIGFTSIEIGTR
ncbi:hypothetical protein HHL21_08730 [Massilia sp. RP-1-19]|uniref:DUF7024 domain-containing protein n=1 Tax=Massilia polaris TaxID=2728846 RepID=A0A848HPJ7_9BURK|nr:hypothetical protein [Massilia polaris]NML61163.1 hypothetical protein [Massilia polaris]